MSPMAAAGSIGDILKYIDGYWSRLIRSNREDRQTLIGLPKPYLVPSDGEMFQEMYYWDSYFMALGLVGTTHEQLIFDMTENMSYLFERFGVIPNASRYYFLSRSQPPFFTAMIMLCHKLMCERQEPDASSFLRRMIAVAEKEYETVWLGTKQPHHRKVYCGLSRYFDVNYLDVLASCESGWDHSTRFDERVLEHLPVDLNSILMTCEVDIASAYFMLGDMHASQKWEARAEQRAKAMTELMWDEELGFFFDYDFVNKRRTLTPSLAGFFPLWSGTATKRQAERMVELWLPKFEKDGGLVTTLQVMAGRQWAAPNGWAPLQWLITAGLEKYGFTDEATCIRRKWHDLCLKTFQKTGTLWEKYNVVDMNHIPEEGLYGSVLGFGWTNGVYVDFDRALKTCEAAQLAE